MPTRTLERKKAVARLAWAAVLIVALADYGLLTAAGAQTPGWLHVWCSAAALHASHGASGASGLLAGTLEALRVHWPHLVPPLIAIATLVYLRRASIRYNAQRQRPS